MNDDGMGGLAMAIGIAMLLILLVAFVLPFFAGRLFARKRGWSGAKSHSASIGMGLLGLACGGLIVIATFFESTWLPPPKLSFIASPGFTGDWVVLLEDPKASQAIDWSGVEMAFFGKSARIVVPTSGILRVKDLAGIAGRADVDVMWSDGAPSSASAGGPAPAGVGARTYSAFNRESVNGAPAADPPFGDQAAFAAYIEARERVARGK
ncbi:MAG: hypothetical protein ABI589_00095 [Burkholderiales bacterium]